MHEQYTEIDATGFEELPDELYKKWLDYISIEKEKAKKAGKNPYIIMNKF